MTDQEIITYIHEVNPAGSSEDVAAFRRMMRCFDCEDSVTPEEGHQRIQASMRMLIDDVEYSGDDNTARAIIADRLKGLNRG